MQGSKPMKIFFSKTKMMLLIYTFSVVIFSLAYNAYYLSENEGNKDIDFLSDHYTTVIFQNENADIEKLIEWKKNNQECNYLIVDYMWSRGKGIIFSKDFFEEMKIYVDDFHEKDLEDNIAVVNNSYKDLCYEENGETFLKIHGKVFRVISFYDDVKDDKMYECSYYLNIASDELIDTNDYNSIIIDSVLENNMDDVILSFQDKFENTSITKWNGNKENIMDNRPYFIIITVLCGGLICLNCIGYSNEWLKFQRQELGIRKLVGATGFKNHILILKRFLMIWGIAYVIGIIIINIVYFILRFIPELQSTRMLFGNQLYVKPALLSGICVIIIGIIMIEINHLKTIKSQMITDIRGNL